MKADLNLDALAPWVAWMRNNKVRRLSIEDIEVELEPMGTIPWNVSVDAAPAMPFPGTVFTVESLPVTPAPFHLPRDAGK